MEDDLVQLIDRVDVITMPFMIQLGQRAKSVDVSRFGGLSSI